MLIITSNRFHYSNKHRKEGFNLSEIDWMIWPELLGQIH